MILTYKWLFSLKYCTFELALINILGNEVTNHTTYIDAYYWVKIISTCTSFNTVKISDVTTITTIYDIIYFLNKDPSIAKTSMKSNFSGTKKITYFYL